MNRRQAPPVRPFGHLSLPADTVEELSNGIRLHYVGGGDQPICRLILCFPGGLAEIGNTVTGKIVMSMLSNGSGHYSTEETADILDFNGVRTGASQRSHFCTLRISMLNHRVAEIMPVMTDFLNAPLFPADRLATACLNARTQIETDIAEPSFGVEKLFDELMLGKGHPLALSPTPAFAEGFTVDKARELYNRLMCTTKCEAFLSGALNEDIIQRVRTALEGVRSRSEGFTPKYVPLMPPDEPKHLHAEQPDSLQSTVKAGMPTIGRNHPDYIPLHLTVMALGGYFGSRLMTNIREKKGLTYGIHASLMGQREGAYLQISAQCDRSYTSRVLDEIRAELSRLATNPPTDRELERLKLYATSALAKSLDGPDEITDFHMTRLMADPPPAPFDARLRAITALNPETIARIAATELNPDRLSTVTDA